MNLIIFIMSLCCTVETIHPMISPLRSTRKEIITLNKLDCETKNFFKIAPFIKDKSDKIGLTNNQMEQVYNLAIKYRKKYITKEELIVELRGGAIENWVGAFGLAMSIIILLNNSDAFSIPGQIIPPHLQWLYGSKKPGNHFNYGKGGKPKSITFIGAIQSNNSEKKEPSSGSWSYIDVMKELEAQSNKKKIDIRIGEQTYTIKNSYCQNADELQFELAEKIYDSIRESDTDISNIASNLGVKADNIKNVKDHVFHNEHDLDRYGPNEIERKRFDASLPQALAWNRLEAGTHNHDDITWIKHECAERHHELKYGSGYSEAHERAQSRYDGYPWKNKF